MRAPHADAPYARLEGGPLNAPPKLYRRRFYVLVVFCSLMFLYGTSHPIAEVGTHSTPHRRATRATLRVVKRPS
jgi:hypothetical protein